MGEVEKLSYVSDAFEELFPKGDVIVIVELEEDDFKNAQSSFRDVDKHYNKFSIKMGNTDFVFVSKSPLVDGSF